LFQITSQLQYIEDSEPVVDGSRNRWCAVQSHQKQTKGATKLSNKKQLKSGFSW